MNWNQQIAPDYFSGNSWQSVLRAIEIRHALTHAKSVNDLNITPAKFQDLKTAEKWFMKVTARLLQVLPTL